MTENKHTHAHTRSQGWRLEQIQLPFRWRRVSSQCCARLSRCCIWFQRHWNASLQQRNLQGPSTPDERPKTQIKWVNIGVGIATQRFKRVILCQLWAFLQGLRTTKHPPVWNLWQFSQEARLISKDASSLVATRTTVETKTKRSARGNADEKSPGSLKKVHFCCQQNTSLVANDIFSRKSVQRKLQCKQIWSTITIHCSVVTKKKRFSPNNDIPQGSPSKGSSNAKRNKALSLFGAEICKIVLFTTHQEELSPATQQTSIGGRHWSKRFQLCVSQLLRQQ